MLWRLPTIGYIEGIHVMYSLLYHHPNPYHQNQKFQQVKYSLRTSGFPSRLA